MWGSHPAIPILRDSPTAAAFSASASAMEPLIAKNREKLKHAQKTGDGTMAGSCQKFGCAQNASKTMYGTWYVIYILFIQNVWFILWYLSYDMCYMLYIYIQDKLCPNLIYSILCYATLVYSILFYSILFYSTLFCSTLFYSFLFYSILFHIPLSSLIF